MKNIETLHHTLVKALRSSGDILLRYFGKAKIKYKGKANLVTEADFASEENIISSILRKFPDHDFLSEERAPKRTGSEYLWIIDPLDGTTNYAHGYPAACVTIGLLWRGQPILGGIYDPFRKELFFARKHHGAFLNGKRIHVSKAPSLDQSLLVTGFPYDRAEKSHYYVKFYQTFMTLCHDVRRSGTAALDLAWIASGRADGFWEFQLKPWDVAAGLLIVREAGGKVTDFHGQDWKKPELFGFQTLATNGKIHPLMLKILHRHLRATVHGK